MSENHDFCGECLKKDQKYKDLLEYTKELEKDSQELYRINFITDKKSNAILPSFQWAVCITLAVFAFVGFLRDPAPTIAGELLALLDYFEFFGFGCAVYYFVYWLKTRHIGKKS